jgi:paraquat-inducible protein A
VLVPVLKLAGIARLLWAVRRGGAPANASRLTRIYAALDFIGRWSMLDVFLVAFLSGAVRFGRLALVEPRGGIVAFAAAVVFTMLATHAFDPHLLWSESPSSPSHGNESAPAA